MQNSLALLCSILFWAIWNVSHSIILVPNINFWSSNFTCVQNFNLNIFLNPDHFISFSNNFLNFRQGFPCLLEEILLLLQFTLGCFSVFWSATCFGHLLLAGQTLRQLKDLGLQLLYLCLGLLNDFLLRENSSLWVNQRTSLNG